jgi:hypothetical protein
MNSDSSNHLTPMWNPPGSAAASAMKKSTAPNTIVLRIHMHVCVCDCVCVRVCVCVSVYVCVISFARGRTKRLPFEALKTIYRKTMSSYDDIHIYAHTYRQTRER